MSRIAIIGGTGLSELVGLQNIKTEEVDSFYGETSGVIESGLLEGEEVVFLSRHGKPHTIPLFPLINVVVPGNTSPLPPADVVVILGQVSP